MASPSTPPTNGDEDEQAFSAWPLLIVIGIAKLATLLVVIVFAWDAESMALIGATAIPWVVAVVALVSAPLVWQWRLRKARRKRAALTRSEWMIPAGDVAPMNAAGESIPPVAPGR